jgi:hypothetical protein
MWLTMLGILAASTSASAYNWTVAFGGCSFSGSDTYSPPYGAPLVRSGSCPYERGTLDLQNKGITAVPADAFAGMTKME